MDGGAYGYASMGPYAGGQAVYGAGPVGLLAVHSAMLRGAAQVFAVDMHPDRLRIAEEFGATPVSTDRGDPAGQIVEATGGMGADCGVEAVGYQAHDPAGNEHPELVMDWLVKSVRTTGRLGVIGVYMPQDPGAATEEAKEGRIAFDFGRLFQKGVARAAADRGARRLRQVRQAGRRLHQGFPASRCLSGARYGSSAGARVPRRSSSRPEQL